MAIGIGFNSWEDDDRMEEKAIRSEPVAGIHNDWPAPISCNKDRNNKIDGVIELLRPVQRSLVSPSRIDKAIEILEKLKKE